MDTLSKKKIMNKLSSMEIENISEEFESNIIKDVNIIKSQTGIDFDKSLDIYLENDFIIVKSICSFFDIPFEKENKNEFLTDVQIKLKELRIIANDKDAYIL